MKSYVITFGDRTRSGIDLPIMFSVGRGGELRQTSTNEVLDDKGVHFTIYDESNSEFVTGIFAGPQRDRDVPLEIARIHARQLGAPMRIKYEDGIAYRYDTRFDCPIRESSE